MSEFSRDFISRSVKFALTYAAYIWSVMGFYLVNKSKYLMDIITESQSITWMPIYT